MAATIINGKFETLVHELTHVLWGTADHPLSTRVTAYGDYNALALAIEDDDVAFDNAENWGIFLEAVGRNSSN